MPYPSGAALTVSEITAFIRTDEPKDITRSTQLVMLSNIICTEWCRKRLLLLVTNFPTNIVSPFT